MTKERPFNEIVAERLKYYLDKYEISQTDLAKRLGVGPTTIYNWLHGIKAPRMDKIDMMCEIFHCWRVDLTEDFVEDHTRLTQPEFDLVEKYRVLDSADRARVDERIDMLLEGEKYKKEALAS